MILRRTLFYALSLVAPSVAAGQGIRFDTVAWDFGRIAEADGPVTHAFRFVNTGDRALVIREVAVSCGCTRPEFSRKPVAPGASGEVRITYDPLNRPGGFRREAAVFTTASDTPARIAVTGEVTPRPLTLDERYPFDWGDGLRLGIEYADFGYVRHGTRNERRIPCINTSPRPLRLTTWTEGTGLLDVNCPAELPAGAEGEIVMRYALPSPCTRYGTLAERVRLTVDGRTAPRMIDVYGVAVDALPAPGAEMSAPKMLLNKNIVKFGTVKRTSGPVTQTLTVTNRGDGTLTIRAVEGRRFGCSLRGGERIDAGKSVEAIITFDPSAGESGLAVERLRIVTDDPARPLHEFRATAVVVE